MTKRNITFVVLLLVLAACNHHPVKMTAILPAARQADTAEDIYTCPMHPQVKEHHPGNCPICGMTLVKKEFSIAEAKNSTTDLHTLLRPTNSAVVSDIPVTALQQSSQSLSIEALGRVAYDTRRTQTIAARFSGRIEKLYVKYRYQHVHAGDKIMDIYSPELVTAQQDLLFVLHNDPTNNPLLDAAKTKLQLLGINGQQLQQVIQSGKPLYKVTVYASYTGHIHEAGTMAASPGSDQQSAAPSGGGSPSMDVSKEMRELPLKEGMYVQKGQTLFQLFNTDQSWIILNLYAGSAAQIKAGSAVTITPETAPEQPFKATIGYIEPFYREDSKTLTARVYFNNAGKMLPIGSQVKAIIRVTPARGTWLPRDAVLSLGLHQIVLKRENGSFQVSAVQTGIRTDSLIQITGGLNAQDSVAADAQYLMDSESFIKVKD
ncbi:MAG TPA: efflux RND transporter periplasmic adaptor subunit [Puia sp.]